MITRSNLPVLRSRDSSWREGQNTHLLTLVVSFQLWVWRPRSLQIARETKASVRHPGKKSSTKTLVGTVTIRQVRPAARDLCVRLKTPLSKGVWEEGPARRRLLPVHLHAWHVCVAARKLILPPSLGLALPGRSKALPRLCTLDRRSQGPWQWDLQPVTGFGHHDHCCQPSPWARSPSRRVRM